MIKHDFAAVLLWLVEINEGTRSSYANYTKRKKKKKKVTYILVDNSKPRGSFPFFPPSSNEAWITYNCSRKGGNARKNVEMSPGLDKFDEISATFMSNP